MTYPFDEHGSPRRPPSQANALEVRIVRWVAPIVGVLLILWLVLTPAHWAPSGAEQRCSAVLSFTPEPDTPEDERPDAARPAVPQCEKQRTARLGLAVLLAVPTTVLLMRLPRSGTDSDRP